MLELAKDDGWDGISLETSSESSTGMRRLMLKQDGRIQVVLTFRIAPGGEMNGCFEASKHGVRSLVLAIEAAEEWSRESG